MDIERIERLAALRDKGVLTEEEFQSQKAALISAPPTHAAPPPVQRPTPANHVNLRNERTGEVKAIKVGWSWTLFLFSGVLGIPLFLRGLHAWGGLMLTIWVVNIVGPDLMPDEDTRLALAAVLMVVGIGLAIFLAVKGNEMTAKHYLENGWVFADPDDNVTRFAKARWSLA